MKPLHRSVLATIVLACATTFAQAPAVHQLLPLKAGYFTGRTPFDLSELVPPPPEKDSAATRNDLAELHEIEQSRTPAEVSAAQSDEKQENMFYLRTVMGDGFTAENLPSLAALSDHIKSEQAVASDALKAEFERARPYQADHTLHPVCGTTLFHNSYPSGHAITGYLEAFTLSEIVPEKSHEILQRADDFAHNRLVCGVHYRGDIVAGRDVAYAVFGYLMAEPRFQSDLAAVRTETRKKLGLR